MIVPTPRLTSRMVIDNYALPEPVIVRLWDGGTLTIHSFHVVGGVDSMRHVILPLEERRLHPDDEALLLAALDSSVQC